MLILSVSPVKREVLAGELRYRKCNACGTSWAEVHTLPYQIRYDPKATYDALWIYEGASRSGAHYVRRCGYGTYGFVPTAPRSQCRFLWHGPVRVTVPEAGTLTVARWRDDVPFAHDAVAQPLDSSVPTVEVVEVEECGACFRSRLTKSEVRQGHLYLRQAVEQVPRIYSERQPGVEVPKTVDTPAHGRCYPIFNHRVPLEHAKVLVRGNIGTIAVRQPTAIYADGHEPLPLDQGEWEFYHPWPARDGGD